MGTACGALGEQSQAISKQPRGKVEGFSWAWRAAYSVNRLESLGGSASTVASTRTRQRSAAQRTAGAASPAGISDCADAPRCREHTRCCASSTCIAYHAQHDTQCAQVLGDRNCICSLIEEPLFPSLTPDLPVSLCLVVCREVGTHQQVWHHALQAHIIIAQRSRLAQQRHRPRLHAFTRS